MLIVNNGTSALTLALPREYAVGFNGRKVITALKRIVLRPGENTVDDTIVTEAGKFKILDFIKSSKPLLGMVREGVLKVAGLEKEYKVDASKVIERMERLSPFMPDEESNGTAALTSEVAQLRALVEGQAQMIEQLMAPKE